MSYIGRSPEAGNQANKIDVSGWTFNGSTQTFPLSAQATNVNQIILSLNGVVQNPGVDFALTGGGNTISFVTAPGSTDSAFGMIFGTVGAAMPTARSFVEDIFTASGDSNVYTLSATPASEHAILVSVDGVIKSSADYSISGRTVVFDSTPTINSKLRILNLGYVSEAYTFLDSSISKNKVKLSGREGLTIVKRQGLVAPGSGTTHSLDFNPINANNILLFVNGLYQTPDYNYSVSGSTLTLGSALDSYDSAHVVFLGY